METQETINNRGAEWYKWDLHVHTPYSLANTQFKGASADEIWENYIQDLENLSPKFKVLGINDYLFIDGYKRVLEYKKKGRLKNIDLILPVIEFRIKRFAGNSKFKRINFHVILSDQIGAEVIQAQFLSGLNRSLELTSGNEKNSWSGIVTKESLEDLGKQIIESVPESERSKFGSPLEEGFNNLNLDEDKIIKLLTQSSYLKEKFLLAIGKTEWDDFSWSDSSIGEKKDVINKVHIVFTAAETVDSFNKAKLKLSAQKVNDLLLDCSDAHHNSNSTQKDRIGNCLTWIKGDRSFNGLKQILNEPDRVYVGHEPEVLNRVRTNKTKYISSINISKKSGHLLPTNEVWFNDNAIYFNAELNAIIGNKGNGKSALADIIALVGDSRNPHFSFLTPDKFCKKNPNRSEYFQATLVWKDDEIVSKTLNEQVSSTSHERVKYISQNLLEKLCNENEKDFEVELRKVIFSHVDPTNRLGQNSLDELIAYQSNIIHQNIEQLKGDLNEINIQIIDLEKQRSPENQEALRQSLKVKSAEILTHQNSKPVAVPEPAASEEIKTEQKKILDLLKQFQEEGKVLEDRIVVNSQRKSQLTIENADLNKSVQAIELFKTQFDSLSAQQAPLLTQYGFDFDSLVALKINLDVIATRIIKNEEEIQNLNNSLSLSQTHGLGFQKIENKKKIKELQDKLDEPSKLYQSYLERQKDWDEKAKKLLGTEIAEGTVTFLNKQLDVIEKELPKKLEKFRMNRIEKSQAIFNLRQGIIDLHRQLYEPVQTFINDYQILIKNYPISIDATLKAPSFVDKFFTYVVQNTKGTFYQEGHRLLQQMLEGVDFNDKDQVFKLLEDIVKALETDMREDFDGASRQIHEQIRKNFVLEFYNFLFGLDYLISSYELKLDNKSIKQLSPGEKGALLLIFYLILDQDDIPLIIDQPEENLDNQSVYKILVPFIKEAKKRRQIIIVTHNPNLAVVCDAENVIHVNIDKADKYKVQVTHGAIENEVINHQIVEILEGTLPAFTKREKRYAVSRENLQSRKIITIETKPDEAILS